MYQVLLVDDEVHAVRGLEAGVRWDRLDVSQVHTAHSLKQAQEVLERGGVDLMVCDIEMPQGSGLELLAWVREHHPRTETVFLTCHSDFGYAKQAISLSSFDYLLKPVDYGELEGVLAKAIDKIGKDRERRRFEETHRKYAQLWEAHRPLRKERFWKDIVEQAIPAIPDRIDSRAAESNLSYHSGQRFLPIYIQVQRWNKTLSQREQRIMEYALRNAAEEQLCGNDAEAAVVPLDNGALLVIQPWTEDESLKRVKSSCDEYIASCNRYFYCDLCVYVGPPAFPPGMAESLRELRRRSLDNVTVANEALLPGELAACRSPFVPPPLKEWAEWMKNGARERLEADIESYLGTLKEEKGSLNGARLQLIYQDFLQMVLYVLQLKGLHANEVFSENLLTGKPEAALRSLQAFREWALNVVEAAMSRLHATEGTLSIVDRVKKFISEQLGEQELSREEIANHVYLNPDYLTRLFKKECGLSISDYLQQQRIEYAKKLLAGSDQSISDIALASGYSNLSYFSTIFKKATGTAPADYRRSCQKP